MCVAACWKGWAEGDTAGRRGCHGVWLIGCQWQPIYTTGNTCMLFVVSFSFNYGLHFLLFTVYLSYLYTHTCSHTFNGPFSRTTWVSWYQKGQTSLDFTEARVSGSGISWAICKSAPRSRQITMPALHYSVFYRPDALPVTQPTASKHWRIVISACNKTSK